jgi:hypothetical protein
MSNAIISWNTFLVSNNIVATLQLQKLIEIVVKREEILHLIFKSGKDLRTPTYTPTYRHRNPPHF